MDTMTLEQLRATTNVGGVSGVTLEGEGSGFFMEITTLNGQDIVLSKARSSEPRRFGSPNSAMIILRDIGIAVAQLDATNWNPDQKCITQSREKRAQAMRTAHEAVAYNQWLASEIQVSIDDPRPSIPHDKVMEEMDVEISATPLVKRKRS
ncbi:hypothetical protein BGZ81_000866 [Podila clonocystis]|nr:hypothetical protein BGZ81_000866 [Podila clonocystis]